MGTDMGMTAREAAGILRVPVGSIYELCASGRLPHLRTGTKGRNIRITQRHIDRYVASCETDESNAPRPKVEVPPTPVPRRGRGRPDNKPLRHIK